MKTILITGAAGYVGFMLVEQFLKHDDVEKIIALDKEEMPPSFANNPRIVYIHKNTSDAWESEVGKYAPEIVIHAAWQIRDMYGNFALQEKWNIGGSDKVFDFVFSQPSVKRLVYFSTVASYGAYPDNTIERVYTEADPFRPSDYRYAEEKRVVELHLEEKYAAAKKAGRDVTVSIIRPAAITGPRGRFARIRFGLQSALSGKLSGSFVYSLVSTLTSFIPATKRWARQFIHEDDIVDIAMMLAVDERVKGYDAFNASPPGAIVLPKDMGEVVGKSVVIVNPYVIRAAFFAMWHLTLGKIPTTRGAWKGYSYPIIVDGSKITKQYGYQYRMPSKDAFQYTDGRYEDSVPEGERRHKKI